MTSSASNCSCKTINVSIKKLFMKRNNLIRDVLRLKENMFTILKGSYGFGGGFDFGYPMEKFGVSISFQMPIQMSFFLPETFLPTQGLLKLFLS
jgi:hypothetical protein